MADINPQNDQHRLVPPGWLTQAGWAGGWMQPTSRPQFIYLDSDLSFSSGTLVSFLAVWGRNQVYCEWYSAQTAHKLVSTGSEK